MNEESNKKLEEIAKSLKNIEGKIILSRKKAFLEGLWRGAGQLVGLVAILILLGWFLNILSDIEPFENTADEIKDVIDSVKNR